jgi:hypothetical protein
MTCSLAAVSLLQKAEDLKSVLKISFGFYIGCYIFYIGFKYSVLGVQVFCIGCSSLLYWVFKFPVLGVQVSFIGCSSFLYWVFKFPVLGVQVSCIGCSSFLYWVFKSPVQVF